MAWDEKGERLAAFSDRIRRVHVWNVSAGSGKSLLPNLFARSIQGTASEVEYSHSVPCVLPSGGGDGTGLGESHGSRLDWKDGQTVTIRRRRRRRWRSESASESEGLVSFSTCKRSY
jgi:hypothetical protein